LASLTLLCAACASTKPPSADLYPPSPPLAPGELRYTVSVGELHNESGWQGEYDLGNAWGRALADMFSRSPRFVVVGDREARVMALEEQDLAAAGATAGGAAPESGFLTPAQLLVNGAILSVEQSSGGGEGGLNIGGVVIGGGRRIAEVTLALAITEATTGQIVASTLVTGTSTSQSWSLRFADPNVQGSLDTYKDDGLDQAVLDAAAQAVHWFERQLPSIPWRGSVVRIDGSTIYVNRGSRDGVIPGQTFAVGEIEIVRDPDSGEVLLQEVREVARLSVTRVEPKLSVCDLASGDPRGLRTGLAVVKP
jgi:curli biogenesis system outer membrane secretion channel CsgG